MARASVLAPAPSVDLGLKPAVRDQLTLFGKAMSGDIVFIVTPDGPAVVATASGWTYTFYVELQTADGELHSWFDDAISSGVSISDDSSLGTASIASTTLTFVKGIATVVVTGDAASWTVGEKATLTVAQATILGYTIASKTGVVTIVTHSLSPSASPSRSPSLSPSLSPSVSPSASPSE